MIACRPAIQLGVRAFLKRQPLLVVLALAALTGCGSPHALIDVSRTRAEVAAELNRPAAPLPPPLAHRPYSTEPEVLREEVAEVCAGWDPGELPALVSDLYLSGVDAGDATEALLRAHCAPLDAIVVEMIAQGQDEAINAVLERALVLGGSGSVARIEEAAILGLDRRARLLEQGGVGALRESLVYGLRYFPSGGDLGLTQAALAMNALFEEVLPGYALYTFVLPGRATPDASSAGQAARQVELLRLIETYAAAGGGESQAESHVFLVPVYANYGDLALADQIAPELAELMRVRLARRLRASGHRDLAERLETHSGPFLVTTLDPHLLPRDAQAPRLLLDLSALGIESLYSLIDAYDRSVPGALAGQPASLALLGERLRERITLDVAQEHWFFWIGRPPAPAAPRPPA